MTEPVFLHIAFEEVMKCHHVVDYTLLSSVTGTPGGAVIIRIMDSGKHAVHWWNVEDGEFHSGDYVDDIAAAYVKKRELVSQYDPTGKREATAYEDLVTSHCKYYRGVAITELASGRDISNIFTS